MKRVLWLVAQLVLGAVLVRIDLSVFLLYLLGLFLLSLEQADRIVKATAVSFEEITDGTVETEARVRRLEHHLLRRGQTDGHDPLVFLDENGKWLLRDESIGQAKGIIRGVRRHDVQKKLDPKSAARVERLEQVRDKLASGERVTEEEIHDAFR